MSLQNDTQVALQDERQRKAAIERKDRERLKKLLAEGLPGRVISERLGVSRRQVVKWIAELRAAESKRAQEPA